MNHEEMEGDDTLREDWTKNAVKAAVLQVYKEQTMDGLDGFTINVNLCQPKHIQVEVRRMYEYVPVDWKVLSTMANVFDTKNINVDNYHTDGCETCDWGSSYETTFDITP